jgi:PAS domain-containing protein/HAMP domain-containing protein
MRRVTIKSRLYATAIGIFVLLFVIGIVANHYIHNALKHFDAMSLIKDINYSELQLRKLEKDFINLETKNENFYKNRRTDYQDRFNEIIIDVTNSISKLNREQIILNNRLNSNLSELNSFFLIYQESFRNMVEITLNKGFKDYGIIGEMRGKIHKVETMAKSKPNYPEFTISMLLLRRNEKDYLLRKDLKYLEKFQQNLNILQNQINRSFISEKEEFKVLLNDYYSLFEKVIQEDIKIGLTQDMGLIHQLNTISKKIESNVSKIQQTISIKAREEVNAAIQTLFIISIILTFIIISILLGVTRRILNSIKRLREFILRLGQGDLPDSLEIKKNDEIADMIKSINALLENLRNTREFALAVGKGNLKEEINVFGNQGDLGGALVEMRKQLLELAEERAENEDKERARNWFNEGVAKFSDIMRSYDKNLHEMSYKILSELINYIDANQGALFILNQEEGEKYLEKIAAVAYGRNKLAGDRIEIGKDIVGRCAYEKKSIYMTNVPEDYIKITSGLGFATPKIIFLAPIKKDNEVLGVIEMASFNEISVHTQSFIERIAENMGTTISAIKVNERTQVLLEKAQEQADEIASQEEELRQNMEEMQATQEEANRRELSLRNELAAIHNLIPIIILNNNGEIIEINKPAEELFNISGSTINGRPIYSFAHNENTKYELTRLIQSTFAGAIGISYVNLSILDIRYNLKIKSGYVKNDENIQHILITLQKVREEEVIENSNQTPFHSKISSETYN